MSQTNNEFQRGYADYKLQLNNTGSSDNYDKGWIQGFKDHYGYWWELDNKKNKG